MGWQEDALTNANAVVNLVGGYTNQREMAAERIVRESLRVNPSALVGHLFNLQSVCSGITWSLIQYYSC